MYGKANAMSARSNNSRDEFTTSVNEDISFSLREVQQRFATRVTNVHELDFIRVLCRIVILMRCKAGLLLANIALLRTRDILCAA